VIEQAEGLECRDRGRNRDNVLVATGETSVGERLGQNVGQRERLVGLLIGPRGVAPARRKGAQEAQHVGLAHDAILAVLHLHQQLMHAAREQRQHRVDGVGRRADDERRRRALEAHDPVGGALVDDAERLALGHVVLEAPKGHESREVRERREAQELAALLVPDGRREQVLAMQHGERIRDRRTRVDRNELALRERQQAECPMFKGLRGHGVGGADEAGGEQVVSRRVRDIGTRVSERVRYELG